MKNKIEWYLRQLLPMNYRSTYTTTDGKTHSCTWKMWLGNCFAVQDFVV